MKISTELLNSEIFLVIKGLEYYQIKMNDIIYVKAINKYVVIKTTKDEFVICTSLKSIAKWLTNFVKVESGLIVNKYYIVKLGRTNKKTYKLECEYSISIELSPYLARKVLSLL